MKLIFCLLPIVISVGFLIFWEIFANRAQLVATVATLWALAFLGAAYTPVPAGHRGVLLRFSAVQGVLDEGFHLTLPLIQSVTLLDVRTQKSSAKATGASSDLQTVEADVAINYHISPDQVGTLYRTVGVFYEDRIIQPAVQETIKSVLARYTAGDLIKLRERVKGQVDAELSKRLLAYNIRVEPNGVSLTNFEFSKEFNEAIEAKQVAQQNAQKSVYLQIQARTEAQTAVTRAKGEAEANRLKAIALDSNGGQKVLAREWIDKWDGHLSVVTGGGSGNILDVRSLMAPPEKAK